MNRIARAAVLLLALAGSACATLSPAERDRAYGIALDARSSQVACDEPDACADTSPIRDLAGQAFAESTPDDPRHYVVILDSGRDAMLARLDMIRSATSSIDLQTYIFDQDDAGHLFLEELLAAARRGVRVRLDSARMEITGHPRYTQWARGPDFFDVAGFPSIEFRSETYDEALLIEGGALHGTLTMRDVSRPVRFVLEPATCEEPGVACDVVASGVVDRTAFGMDGWRVAIGDAVRFELRVRTQVPGVTE